MIFMQKNPLSYIRSGSERFRILIYLLICSIPALISAADHQNALTAYRYAMISNDQVYAILEGDWTLTLAGDKDSHKVNLPMLAPASVEEIRFFRSFFIPDSLQKRALFIRFTGIQGFASIRLNNIDIRHHMNFPSGLTFEVPANLLNLSGENTLEILIHSREKPDQGIPDMVRVFAPTDFLGLSGIVYLIWNAPLKP